MKLRVTITATTMALFLCASIGLVRAADKAAEGDDATRFANRLVDAAHNQDGEAASKMVDFGPLLDRATTGTDAPADFVTGFKRGVASQIGGMLSGIIKAGGPNGYHFLRIRQVNGKTRMLFRLLQADNGLNYHDWIIEKDDRGALRIVDGYIAATGELLSETMHRAFVQAATAANPGVLDRLTGKDKERAANFSKLDELVTAGKGNDPQKVLDLYKQLPKSLQEDKTCLMFRLRAAEQIRERSPQDYQAVMADYLRLFPGDPSVDLICMDAYLQKRQFAELREALARIDRFTGGDPYVNVLRGSSYVAEGGDANLDKGKQLFEKAIEQEPTLSPAYWSLVSLSMETKQYDQTAALLTRIEKNLHMKISDLTGNENYAGFVKSEAYKKWMAGRKSAAPGKS